MKVKMYVVMSASPLGDTRCEGVFSTEDNARKFVRNLASFADVWVERHELDKGMGCTVCCNSDSCTRTVVMDGFCN